MTVKTKQNVTIFAQKAHEVSQKAALKLELRDKAKAALEEAKGIYAEGNDKAKNANDIASKGAIILYDLQTSGMMNKEEVSSLLGQVYGFKEKKDGTPSKTPNGKGEDIRKRVVRAVAAKAYSDGLDDPYFAGVDRNDVYSAIHNMVMGENSIWTTYDQIGQLVKEAKEAPAPLHLNPEKLMKLIDELKKPETAIAVSQSDTLTSAYAELQLALAMLDQMVTKAKEHMEAEAA